MLSLPVEYMKNPQSPVFSLQSSVFSLQSVQTWTVNRILLDCGLKTVDCRTEHRGLF